MASLTRYTPFDNAFDGLFRSFVARPSAFDAEPVAKARMDVTEDEAAYTVHAEIPGVKKDDIQVTIDGNQVAITAEVKHNQEDKQGEKVLRSERYYGKVHRAFSLAQEVDEAASEARYTDGVLELRLPKKAAVSAKKLSIQ
ncbi:MAG TPA: Hsp20/alpha crystallin family protein [Burkholderiales bacterium]|jgi:HSP20 family protein